MCGVLQLPRMSHVAAAIDTKIYVLGGGNGSERCVWLSMRSGLD